MAAKKKRFKQSKKKGVSNQVIKHVSQIIKEDSWYAGLGSYLKSRLVKLQNRKEIEN